MGWVEVTGRSTYSSQFPSLFLYFSFDDQTLIVPLIIISQSMYIQSQKRNSPPLPSPERLPMHILFFSSLVVLDAQTTLIKHQGTITAKRAYFFFYRQLTPAKGVFVRIARLSFFRGLIVLLMWSTSNENHRTECRSIFTKTTILIRSTQLIFPWLWQCTTMTRPFLYLV